VEFFRRRFFTTETESKHQISGTKHQACENEWGDRRTDFWPTAFW
jgi:hypothetical protein